MELHRNQISSFSIELFRSLEEAYRHLLGNQLQKIINEQMETVGLNKYPGYRVGGQVFFFSKEITPVVTTLQYAPKGFMPHVLDKKLMPRHEQWMAHYQCHDRDFPRIRQMLGSILMRCKTSQDIRDVFPEYVIRGSLGHELLIGLERSRPSAFAGDPPPPGTVDDPYWSCHAEAEFTWGNQVVEMYARIAESLDTYLGYKLLT